MAFCDAKAILTRAFRDMDKNGDGYLDGFEVAEVFKKYYAEKGKKVDFEQLTKKVLEFMNKVAKKDKKLITLDEFLAYFLVNDFMD